MSEPGFERRGAQIADLVQQCAVLVFVDFVGRFESLVADFGKALTQIGVKEAIDLPRLKAKARTDKRPYREFMTSEQQQYIADNCRAEIELLGYRFE